MPELPEVETVRRGLVNLAVGHRINSVDVFYEKMILNNIDEFKDKLKGKKIVDVNRRGKYLLIRLSDDLTIVSHLRMEGKYFGADPADPIDKHTHVIFHLDDNLDLCYNDTRKFGRMILINNGEENTVSGLKDLGPEPTENTLSVDYLLNKMSKSKKPIKTWLLDQSNIAGLGNIYCDEVLWMTKIHPLQPANTITKNQIKDLRQNIFKELNLAIKAHGTTVFTYSSFGHTGEFQDQLHAYGHVGKPCDRCGTEMIKIKVGQRGTTYCPKEQVLSKKN
ncbi:MAG: DNA-formamidopyrimidine glycosylase [Firmicutes bacterium]|uniref:Formamidopyrimidine-DNA glycosylase n=1 Tax=Candidatus Gallilactobacillus intestinavium TaxID=2840838 RepID=A0A9D9E8D9_9LACO|nr:DNA-formamidopyrimidine glycosylase [Candidatus Gallilactobacillus intestinavium]